MKVSVTRKNIKFLPDSSRVVARYFNSGNQRTKELVGRILVMGNQEVTHTLEQIYRGFARRHRSISAIFYKHYENIRGIIDEMQINEAELSEDRKMLIGSYLTMEYSIESSAFFNPSMVKDFDQSSLEKGEVRVVISFRATGEGHVSSIVFRRGIIDKDNNLRMMRIGDDIEKAEILHKMMFNKKRIMSKLAEMDTMDIYSTILNDLPEVFEYSALKNALTIELANPIITKEKREAYEEVIWLMDSFYDIQFNHDSDISERVIFPVSDTESRGIEDARFVRFVDDDGSDSVMGTYTAYNGNAVLSKLITTEDFYTFRVMPLYGEGSLGKGMALFPKKINGKYAMLGRMDGVNNYLMYSVRPNEWKNPQLIQRPEYSWEYTQVGNCGSPLWTEEGWLIITHGVGAMRRYCIGASLFDLDDPSKEIGRLSEPLLTPLEDEREGYVPNVVYSCGSIIHNKSLILPYAVSDYASSYAVVDLKELLDALKDSKKNLAMKTKPNKAMLLMSSYPPRECGLATFTNDVVNFVNLVFGDSLPIEVCALQNHKNQFEYPSEVKYILNVTSIDEYRHLAEKINNRDDIGMICIEHEFGLFGGEYGNYLLSFLLALNKPIATVFHTVLPGPNDKLKKVVQAIIDLSNKIVVLTNKSQEILIRDYGCRESKTMLIPHGTHMVLLNQKEDLKKEFNFSDKIVLSTFGLISENKNIETVLYALPEIIAKHPEVVYLVMGKTHPEILKKDGENYRNMLIEITRKLQLENNVFFVNEFLELKQLLDYLILSDIYLFASKDPNQAVSGTFAYAMSCGCAIISTPIPHAIEALNTGTGILLDSFDQPEAFRKAIMQLVENKKERMKMGRNGYALTHETTWENIALKYGFLFAEVTESVEALSLNFPPIKLDHVKELTTDYGILQFSNFSQPDLSYGYTLDDNARALIDMVMYHDKSAEPIALKLAAIYLNFITGIQREDGSFDNYKDFNRQLTPQNELVNLEDSNGRALWSLGFTLAHCEKLPLDLVQQAQKAWDKAVVHIHKVGSPRAIAYTLKGLYYYHLVHQEEDVKKSIVQLADKLLNHYHINSDEDWCWYEDYMTYANNVLPEAMLFSFLATGDLKYKKIALVTFDFLLSHYFMKGEFSVISNRGWFVKGSHKNTYGEQPIEVATTIITLHLFYEITGNVKYKEQLKVAFSWFLGNNHLHQIIYNPVNGASYDGLEEKNVNINQGAESTLCFFKVQLIMDAYKTQEDYKY